ncbi:MAG: hypothetical protein KGJ44_13100 [Betaproteobacteria bacterium]|nr:hypothetical protein [Betaproteobacteria bacterium]
MKATLALAMGCALLLGACAAPPQKVRMAKWQAAPAASSTFSFSDTRAAVAAQRQADEAKAIAEAPKGTLFRDDQIEPAPPTLIEASLRRVNPLLDGAKVELLEFELVYEATAVRQSPTYYSPPGGFAAGAIGAAVVFMLDATKSPDYCHASAAIGINGQRVDAQASAAVSKYSSEAGVQGLVDALLDALLTNVLMAMTPAVAPAGSGASADTDAPVAAKQ